MSIRRSSHSTGSRRVRSSAIIPRSPAALVMSITYMLANLRLVLDVEVMAGNQHAFNHAAAGLWALLDRIGRDRWPQFLRGDAGVASDALMRECEQRGLPYLFKLRVTNNVK